MVEKNINGSMKKLTYALLILLMTAACAKDSNESHAAADQNIATVPPPEANQQGQYQPNGGYQPGYQQGHQRPPYGYQPQGQNCDTNYQQFMTREQYCRALKIDIRRNRCVTQQHIGAYQQFCQQRQSPGSGHNQGPYRR